jgi:hypothetical protein
MASRTERKLLRLPNPEIVAERINSAVLNEFVFHFDKLVNLRHRALNLDMPFFGASGDH